VNGDTIDGTVRIGEGPGSREAKWTAKLAARGEMRRASDDVAGR
jgi:hypothetical protein